VSRFQEPRRCWCPRLHLPSEALELRTYEHGWRSLLVAWSPFWLLELPPMVTQADFDLQELYDVTLARPSPCP